MTIDHRDLTAFSDDPNNDTTHNNRFQSVIGMDFDDWEAACEAFDIKHCLIKHRKGEGREPVGEQEAGRGDGEEGGPGVGGWYT